MGHEQTIGVSSTVLDQKQQNIFGCISLFWSVVLRGHSTQRKRGDHSWFRQRWAQFVEVFSSQVVSVNYTSQIKIAEDKAANNGVGSTHQMSRLWADYRVNYKVALSGSKPFQIFVADIRCRQCGQCLVYRPSFGQCGWCMVYTDPSWKN